MKFILAFLFCTIYTGAFSKEDIIEKMAAAVCLCLKEKEIKPGATSYTTCVLEELKPHKKSIKKLIKQIVRHDNKGEDLDALDAFNEKFENALNKNCPGFALDFSDIFNDLLK